ncbi:Protein singed [Nymphon striatum]|nr:Protein singed [Nymphon striatum]
MSMYGSLALVLIIDRRRQLHGKRCSASPSFPPNIFVNRENMNGIANGSSGSKTQWSIGLLNNQHKYLTAETFGCKINANGSSLKKKQLWTLEVSSDDNTTDDCDNETKFTITYTPEGLWAFKNEVRKYYLGACTDKLICAAKTPGKAELWTPHLHARPQVNIRSVGRKRYAHLSESQEEVQEVVKCDVTDDDVSLPGPEQSWLNKLIQTFLGATIPCSLWNFRDQKYAIHNSCTNSYLQADGRLSTTFDAVHTLFTLEFHSGYLALKDNVGQYLSPTGKRRKILSLSIALSSSSSSSSSAAITGTTA